MKIAEGYSKWVKNTVGKGEIARYEQFLLFPQCFQKACFPGASKGVIVWEWVKLCEGVIRYFIITDLYIVFRVGPKLFSNSQINLYFMQNVLCWFRNGLEK